MFLNSLSPLLAWSRENERLTKWFFFFFLIFKILCYLNFSFLPALKKIMVVCNKNHGWMLQKFLRAFHYYLTSQNTNFSHLPFLFFYTSDSLYLLSPIFLMAQTKWKFICFKLRYNWHNIISVLGVQQNTYM